MSENVKSLWPSQIRPKVLSPKAILNAQAAALVRQTGGILLGEVKSRFIDAGRIELELNIVVPALYNYRHRILSVGHKTDLPYPALVDAEVFRDTGSWAQFNEFVQNGNLGVHYGKISFRADSDQEFTNIVASVFQSPQVLSAAQALIARASEALAEKEEQMQIPPASQSNSPSDELAGERGDEDIADEEPK